LTSRFWDLRPRMAGKLTGKLQAAAKVAMERRGLRAEAEAFRDKLASGYAESPPVVHWLPVMACFSRQPLHVPGGGGTATADVLGLNANQEDPCRKSSTQPTQ
jgi:hypothetical protein